MNARQQSTLPPTSITPISSSPPQSQQQQGSQPPPPPSQQPPQQQPPPGSVIRLRIHHDQVSLLRSSSPTPSPPTTTTVNTTTATTTNTTTTSSASSSLASSASSSASTSVVAPTIPTTPIAPQSSTPITLITANSSSIANSLRSNTMMSGTMYKQTARKSITTPPRKQLCSIPLSYSSSTASSYSIIGAAQSSVHNDEISSTSSSSSSDTATMSLNSGEIHSLQRRKRRRTLSTSPGNDSETEESDHERNDTIMMSDESAKSKRSNEVIVADQSSFDSSSSSSSSSAATTATKYVTAPRNIVLSSFNARSSSASSAAAAAAFAGSVTEATATAVLSSGSSSGGGGGSGEASLVSGVRGGLRKNPRRREVYDPLTGESAPAAILVSDSESEEVVTSQRRARRSNRSNTSTNSTGSTGSGSSSQDSMNLTSSSQDMSPGVDQVVSSQDKQRLSSESESERANSGKSTIEERTSPGDSGRTMGPKRIANSDDIRRKITFVSKAPKRHHESAVASAPITLVPMTSSAAAAPATVPLASVATIATPPTPTVGTADAPPVEKVRIQLFQNDRDFLDVFGSSFRINGSFTDYTIVFKHSGNRFRTHRIVLAGHSSLLRSMLTNEAQEVLEVDDSVFKENVFFTIIGLLYPGSSVRVRYNQIPHMLMIANHFGLHKLIQVLVTVFSHHLNDNIVLSCWNLKYTDETRPLIEIAESYIQKQNFKLILKEHKHVMLSFDGWYRLLQSIPVNTDNALDLIDSISAWVKHDRPNRAQYLTRLMQLIQGT